MNGSQLNGATRGFGISLAITCVLSALLVLAKESNDGLMNLMKKLTVHHWVTHSLFVVAVFLILGFILSKSRGGEGVNVSDAGVLKAIVGSIALGTVIIAGFYLTD